jgi:hypothetical protein
MNLINKSAAWGANSISISQFESDRRGLIRVDTLLKSLCPVLVGLMMLFLADQLIAAEELNPDKFRRMVQAELERTEVVTDSVGTTLKVIAFGDQTRDFMLAPIISNGKLAAVYKDDPKRNGVTRLASTAVLKSVRLDLFSVVGARQVLQDKGYTSGEPVAVSVGPCSLFGVLETGWYLPVGESFVLLSMEGRIASESDVTRFWPGKLTTFKQIRLRLLPKE